jgi:hypothetical protein
MPASADPERPTEEPSAALHVCPECASELVQPIRWAPVDSRRWRVELRCPECEWGSDEVHDQGELDAYDDVLEAGTDALIADLALLQRANMEGDIELLGRALDDDLLLPEDF